MRHCVSPEVNRVVDALCKQMDVDEITEVRVTRYVGGVLDKGASQIRQKVEFVVRVEVMRPKEEKSNDSL